MGGDRVGCGDIGAEASGETTWIDDYPITKVFSETAYFL